MKRCFLYLMKNQLVYLGVWLGLELLMMAGCLLTGPETGMNGFFVTYLRNFPVMMICLLFVWGISGLTTCLNLALSMGARRADYFKALQLIFLVILAAVWIMQAGADWVILRLDAEAGVKGWGFWEGTIPSRNPGVFLLYALTMTLSGTMARFSLTHKAFGMILMLAVVIVLSAGGALVMLITGASAEERALWGDLPWIMLTVCGILAAVFDGLIWKQVKKAVVV